MKTNFKEYLVKKNTQKIIDKFAKQFGNNKVVLYGAGLFAGDLMRNYDFSGLNIIGVADKKFQDDLEGDFYGYKKMNPCHLPTTEFDLLLITTFDDTGIKAFLKNDLLRGENAKFKIKTLIRQNLIEYVKCIIRGEL